MVAVEPGCGAKRRVAGERNFFGGEKNAHLHTMLAFDFGRARKDEGGLAEISFAGEGLHLVCGEAAGISEDGESVAFERIFGEDIDLRVIVCAMSRRGRCCG